MKALHTEESQSIARGRRKLVMNICDAERLVEKSKSTMFDTKEEERNVIFPFLLSILTSVHGRKIFVYVFLCTFFNSIVTKNERPVVFTDSFEKILSNYLTK